MTKAQAHRILDQAKAGRYVSERTIRVALAVTGDLASALRRMDERGRQGFETPGTTSSASVSDAR